MSNQPEVPGTPEPLTPAEQDVLDDAEIGNMPNEFDVAAPPDDDKEGPPA